MGADDKPILERIERVLAELSRSIGEADAKSNRGIDSEIHHNGPDRSAPTEPHVASETNSRLAIATAWIRSRAARDEALGNDLFFDPAWSILLELYIHHCRQTVVSITALCIAAKVPSSTGLRWVDLLERRGLVKRQPDPFDRRKIYATLVPEAVKKIEETLDDVVETNRQLGIKRVRGMN